MAVEWVTPLAPECGSRDTHQSEYEQPKTKNQDDNNAQKRTSLWMKDYRRNVKLIFSQKKSFGLILVILLSAVCIYPPFVMMTEGGIIAGRK